MSDALDTVCSTKEQAHAAAVQGYAHAQALLANGERVRITVAPDHDDITVKQRRFLHGPVLRQISEQVRVDGVRYTAEVWKEHLRRLFLPDRWEMRKVPRWDAEKGMLVPAKRATPHRVRVSTEDLSIKQYSEYIDRVLAHAATEWGVQFRFETDEREAVRYVPKRRKGG